MDLFSKQSPAEIATKTSASKLSNGAALIVNDLAKEPTKGLMHVLTHVHKSVPILLETHTGLEAANTQLQAVLDQLQDAQDGIISITGPATQQDLASLATSLHSLQQLAQQQQQKLQRIEQDRQQELAVQAEAVSSISTNSNSGAPAGGSSGFAKLWRSS